ncbi:MAG: UDP-N-acetylmuramyl-tripeptide synthetase [Candidatus Pacebacteria bacterium]|nr:UDP-N-acetylmuramyl-tripeptide synthetase [Candidatus Paceibacterota bacterium]
MKSFVKRILPKQVFALYHFLLALTGALRYRFPSQKLVVIGVTGTKGKSSVAELVNAILEEAGYTTALLSTIRFKVGDESRPNLLKMTMPGRFFVQRFLFDATHAGCTHAVIEMTSEGVTQFRHRFIDLDALIFTNIAPEHIESHGSFENYLAAKLKLRDALEASLKENTAMIANTDDAHGKDFLNVSHATPIPFSLSDVTFRSKENGVSLSYKDIDINSKLKGAFNAYNILAAIKLGEYLNIPLETIRRGIENVSVIPGRVEHIHKGQMFDVVIDYAHTPDSLCALYDAFDGKRKVCVLGNTGGGRDTWKRPEMGKIADRACDVVILTNEDPYDEDPEKIVREMAAGMEREPSIIMDRREAIREAIENAARDPRNTAVLISGKGTDPFIMEANGKKTSWSDKRVAEEELARILPNA